MDSYKDGLAEQYRFFQESTGTFDRLEKIKGLITLFTHTPQDHHADVSAVFIRMVRDMQQELCPDEWKRYGEELLQSDQEAYPFPCE